MKDRFVLPWQNKKQVLSESERIAKQKWEEFQKELVDERGQIKSPEAMKPLLSTEKGPPEIFLRHGMFPLLQSFTQTELKMLFLALCLDSGCCFRQTFYLETLRISRSHISTTIKKLVGLKLLIRGRPNAKGRARGRQLAYMLDGEARKRLEKDLSELEFFRNAVRAAVRPVALCFSELPWRKDLGLLDREN